ncbi:hypothetical protein [Hazenella coriacea]|uniref:Uncharacterized protein n=1 Tax=Hazenella coriacea TaxID=1179467 RepID=A0A4R3L4B7_9BACL|nr:hypothetical protein [Hazenella coriacea]TCS94142.1 hypothetical protein EDD58_1048 [Hazenella coriacea]
MAKVISLEQVRDQHMERVRRQALSHFPWSEMENITTDFVDPMTRFWSEQKKSILLDLIYRLGFEAYVYGILEAKRVRIDQRYLIPNHQLEDVYRLFYQEECQQLIHEVADDFSIWQWLDEWRCESLFILLEHLVQVLFVLGARQRFYA